MFRTLFDKYKAANSYKKRGIIYISISLFFLLYEIFGMAAPRTPVVLLWLGVILIALVIMTTLKDPRP